MSSVTTWANIKRSWNRPGCWHTGLGVQPFNVLMGSLCVCVWATVVNGVKLTRPRLRLPLTLNRAFRGRCASMDGGNEWGMTFVWRSGIYLNLSTCDICISSFISRSAAERMEKEGKTRLTLCYCLCVSPAVLKTRASDFCDSSLFEACAWEENITAQKLLFQSLIYA